MGRTGELGSMSGTAGDSCARSYRTWHRVRSTRSSPPHRAHHARWGPRSHSCRDGTADDLVRCIVWPARCRVPPEGAEHAEGVRRVSTPRALRSRSFVSEILRRARRSNRPRAFCHCRADTPEVAETDSNAENAEVAKLSFRNSRRPPRARRLNCLRPRSLQGVLEGTSPRTRRARRLIVSALITGIGPAEAGRLKWGPLTAADQ